MIQIPNRFRSFNWLFILMTLYTAVWMGLEGNVGRVLLMGGGWTAVLLLHFIQTYAGGRLVRRSVFVLETAVGGLLFALSTIALTLIFMVLQTGIHGHGAEFSPQEINTLIGNLPIALLAGLLAGAGVGLLIVALKNNE
jgi:hypothetical protein